MEKEIRKPAVAGTFYPNDADELKSTIQHFLSDALPQEGPVPKAIIAPHAGYIYSGPVAASAYIQLIPARFTIKRVILLGPSHRVPLHGLAASSASHFATPLGLIPIEQPLVNKICQLPQVAINDQAHTQEHSLEVHLPFLQQVLDEFTLVPLVVGQTSPEQVNQVLSELWDGKETLVVISSDLSHYHEYSIAKQLDQKTTDAIEHLAYQEIDYENACGRDPVNGLLHFARQIGLKADAVDVRNSGDTAGTRDQVVGYGAYLFH
ncbi:MAG: AmmeMemoRadiSam system protein B [Gammaproteobacteria bacterium]|nr:AmmeMemoRadiSam system protein B [Gammaproteobacteria bacterium]